MASSPTQVLAHLLAMRDDFSMRIRAEITRLFDGLDLVEPGVARK